MSASSSCSTSRTRPAPCRAGLGTLDEVIEFVTWRQLGLHCRTMVILNTDGYWDGLGALTGQIVGHAFAKPAVHGFFDYTATPEEAVEALSRL